MVGKGGVSFNGREFENCGWVIARWVSTSLGRPGPDVSDVAYGEIKSFLTIVISKPIITALFELSKDRENGRFGPRPFGSGLSKWSSARIQGLGGFTK